MLQLIQQGAGYCPIGLDSTNIETKLQHSSNLYAGVIKPRQFYSK